MVYGEVLVPMIRGVCPVCGYKKWVGSSGRITLHSVWLSKSGRMITKGETYFRKYYSICCNGSYSLPVEESNND